MSDMRQDLNDALLPTHGEALDPVDMARRDLRKHLPRRFYKNVTAAPVEGGFRLELDGRAARTPARHPLVVPHKRLVDALVEEWGAQDEVIDPALMPITRLVNSTIDGVAQAMDEVRADLVKYASSDLLCYRADGPDALVALQDQLWDPVLAHFQARYGVRFALAQGVNYVTQPEDVMVQVRADVAQIEDAFVLAGVHSLTTITGSALLALAHLKGHMSFDALWAAAHVDEDFQMRHWGQDSEALARRAARHQDGQAAAQLLANCAP